MEVPTLQQFNELLEQVKTLREEHAKALGRLERLEAVKRPTPWYQLKDARKSFGVDRHTFKKWVLEWIDNGTLVRDIHYKTVGDAILINEDFLCGQLQKPGMVKLKKAG